MHNDQGPPDILPPRGEEDIGGVTSAIAKVEVDTQIATAKQWPRSIKKATLNAIELATSSREIAEGCYYAIPREGKTITGPSIELAVILASTWGNLRYGARPVASDAKFVYAQGVCHDLEANNQFSFNATRRITKKNGARYGDDMIGVTMAAACSIALRNAILKVIPNYREVYAAVLTFLQGDEKGHPDRRVRCVEAFGKIGVSVEKLLAKMERKCVEDLTAADVFDLRGFYTAIREETVSVDTIFASDDAEKTDAKAKGIVDQLKKKNRPTTRGQPKAQSQPAQPAPSSQPAESTEPTEPPSPGEITPTSIETRIRDLYRARKSFRGVIVTSLFGATPIKDCPLESLERADAILNEFEAQETRPEDAKQLSECFVAAAEIVDAASDLS
jgi:hypothetical protein